MSRCNLQPHDNSLCSGSGQCPKHMLYIWAVPQIYAKWELSTTYKYTHTVRSNSRATKQSAFTGASSCCLVSSWFERLLMHLRSNQSIVSSGFERLLVHLRSNQSTKQAYTTRETTQKIRCWTSEKKNTGRHASLHPESYGKWELSTRYTHTQLNLTRELKNKVHSLQHDRGRRRAP